MKDRIVVAHGCGKTIKTNVWLGSENSFDFDYKNVDFKVYLARTD